MIVNADCLEYLRELDINSGIKCIFMDIPDNIGLNYTDYNDNRDPLDYYNWINLLILEALPRCKLFWLTYNAIHDVEIKYIVRNILKYKHPAFTARTFIWRYLFGQYNEHDSPSGYRPILRLKRTDCKLHLNSIREMSTRQKLEDKRIPIRGSGSIDDCGRIPDDVFNIPRVTGNSYEKCDWIPCQLPMELMKIVILMSVNREELFIDCFGGSGSSIRAALNIGHKNIVVIEKCKEYCDKMMQKYSKLEEKP